MRRQLLLPVLMTLVTCASGFLTYSILAQVITNSVGTPSCRAYRDAGGQNCYELKCNPSPDAYGLHLDYKESKRTDEHGNRFKYRAKVADAGGAKVSRWAWDVFLVSGQ